MVSLTGSDSPASDPASFGGPDPVPHASGSETPFPRRRDLRNSDKDYSPDDPATNPAAETGQDVPQVAEKDYGKAGRNLPAAIGIGLLIGGVVLASLVFFPISFLFIILVAIVAAMWELANALSRSGSLVSRIPTMVSAACMVLATFVGGREALWVTFAASAGAVMLFTMVERRKNAVKDVSLSLFALTYVGLMACFVVYLLTQPDGNLYVILFLASVVASDTGGYVFGVLWGKHPIAPRISPKKSWEGYFGSVVFAAAVATILALTLFDAPFWTGLVFGVVIPAFATLGDFSESMIKRDLELKDMGTLLPGHGGVMDRLDSILPTAPVALVMFSVLPGYL
ncbi:phosphatidate cytidylyltransferase [Brevibacterium aurantiacum]|uniref:Phosphatidate cytidylyltransferase n=1 Tax=Brevibacterium aurantiacum TaxID=273384 RepID=A0A2A3Z8X0_BREAU|nr:phosphatidate cytidylyltransferase [Brevibacterium aurantiacum]MDN5549540.1 phosphatidate cytidylyltransferase [Brevibacterium sp.]AOP54269.1 Phosphatidate cytidylyltransferase [Brevibacterium aurantiacum]MDN5734712.1 phosphatidate cytidylyltransferase [Brevibacterium aurantiacum]MDN5774280.1 phosphatidate cytidylyltransferase [Brevibacterium aurantiacum]MDN5793336.1 phosphatidate cytidylyltransferase [Brevibacterium aurantiacum]